MRISLGTIAILFFLMCTATAMAAQDTMPPADWKEETPQAHAERGLSLMVKGDYENAFKAMFGKSHTKEKLEKLKFEIYRLAKKQGKPFGYETVVKRKVGTRLLRYRYILFFEKQPIMFEFNYYKKRSGWGLKNIHYSMDIRKMYEN